jgi:glutaredoxin 3
MQEIVVYTTPVCAYCVAAKRLLAQRGLTFKEIDLQKQPELRQRLSDENGGYRTVPMIFIGKTFVGGFDELADLDRTGRLQTMVQGG